MGQVREVKSAVRELSGDGTGSLNSGQILATLEWLQVAHSVFEGDIMFRRIVIVPLGLITCFRKGYFDTIPS
jgi:hypothetical protein